EEQQQRKEREEEVVGRGGRERRYVVRADFANRLFEKWNNANSPDHHASMASKGYSRIRPLTIATRTLRGARPRRRSRASVSARQTRRSSCVVPRSRLASCRLGR